MKKKEIVASTDASVNITSNVLDLGDLTKVSVHVRFTGSDVVGTLTLEASNDQQNWEEVSDSSQAISSSEGHMYNVAYAHYQFLRLQWVYTSGTGNISCGAVIKENPIIGA